jgi:hypothetical protein
LVRTLTSDVSGLTKMKSGHNLIIALMVADGTAQEDSIVMRKKTTIDYF